MTYSTGPATGSRARTPLLVLALALLMLASCRPGSAADPTPTAPPTATLPTSSVASPTGVPPTAVPTPTPLPPVIYEVGLGGPVTARNTWEYLAREPTVWNGYALDQLHAGLYGLSAGEGYWVPRLAQGFPSQMEEEEIDGGRRWTSRVRLKEDVRWSDGVGVTAFDVAFTFETARRLQLGGEWAAYTDSRYVDDVEVLGPYELKVIFKRKPGLAVWPFGLAMMPVLPEHYWTPVVAEAGRQRTPAEAQERLFAHIPEGAPTSGPFFLKTRGVERIELARNPHYYLQGVRVTEYEKAAYLEERPGGGDRFQAYGEPGGEVNARYTVGPFVDGVRYHVARDKTARPSLQEPTDLDTVVSAGASITLAFNLRRPPLDSLAFREAVAMLVDGAIQGLPDGVPGDRLYSLVPPSIEFWHNPDATYIDADPGWRGRVTRAVERLEASRFTFTEHPAPGSDAPAFRSRGSGLRGPEGEELPVLRLLTVPESYDVARARLAGVIAETLEGFGVSVKVVTVEPELWSRQVVRQHDFDMALLGLSLPRHPSHLERLLHSSHAGPGGWNLAGYSSATYDAVADGMLSASDPQQARQLAFELQRLAAQDLPYVPLFGSAEVDVRHAERVVLLITGRSPDIESPAALPSLVRLR